MNELTTLLFYLAIILGGAFLIFLDSKIKKRVVQLLSAVGTAAVLGLISAFRGNAGTDSPMYRRAYEYGENSILRWVDFEPGYRALMDFLRSYHFPYQVLFFVMGFFTTLFMILAILHERREINVYVASVIFLSDFYLVSMNIVRQAMAMSICIYAICLFFDGETKSALPYPFSLLDIRKKTTKAKFGKQCIAVGMILIASQFHTSALFCLVIIFGKLLFTQKRTPIILISAFVCVSIFLLKRDLLFKLILLLTGSYYYASYFNSDVASDGSFFGYYIKLLPIIAVALMYYPKYRNYTKMHQLFAFLMIGIMISSIGVITDSQVNRIGFYFKYLDMIIIGYCTRSSIRVSTIKITSTAISIGMCAFYLLLFYYKVFLSNFAELVPYGG